MAKSPVITVGRSLPQHVWGLVKDVVPPMHAAGRPFVAGALTLGVFGWRYGWARRSSLVAAGTLALFFRAPKRVPPPSVGAVVAPADGVVAIVDESVPPAELELGRRYGLVDDGYHTVSRRDHGADSGRRDALRRTEEQRECAGRDQRRPSCPPVPPAEHAEREGTCHERTSRRVHGRDDVLDQPPDVLGERAADGDHG